MEKLDKESCPIALDGARWNIVKPIGNDSIDEAARSLDALADAVCAYAVAKCELEKASADIAANAGSYASSMRSVAERLRNEAEKRRADVLVFASALVDSQDRAGRIHTDLAGVIPALSQYASGAVGIDSPVDYHVCGIQRRYVPTVTDELAEKMANFKPARRAAPDTSAVAIPPGTVPPALARLAEARARYDSACKSVAAELDAYTERAARLSDEARAEEESVKSAAEAQTARGA